MQTFGMTNPCSDIAKHFGVSQAYVDHVMEWELHEAGIRSASPGSKHAVELDKLAQPIKLNVRIQIGVAIDQVIRDMKAVAASQKSA